MYVGMCIYIHIYIYIVLLSVLLSLLLTTIVVTHLLVEHIRRKQTRPHWPSSVRRVAPPEDYEVPPLPSVVQVDAMHISQICLTLWCALKLKSVHFLPSYVRAALRVLSLSGHFTLDGATLRLEERRLPPHRGSMADFTRGLYMYICIYTHIYILVNWLSRNKCT